MEDREHNGASFYAFLTEGKLMGSRCGSCRALYVPPRQLCPACYGSNMAWEEMGGTGKLIGFTTVHIGTSEMIAAGYDRTNPYCTGIVRLTEGPAISGQIVGVDAARPDSIAVGTLLRASFVERGAGDGAGRFLAFEPVD